jgi:hypothetical protein
MSSNSLMNLNDHAFSRERWHPVADAFGWWRGTVVSLVDHVVEWAAKPAHVAPEVRRAPADIPAGRHIVRDFIKGSAAS